MEHPAVAEAGVIGKPGPDGRRDRQGVRGAEARHRAERGTAQGTARPCPQALRPGGGAQGDRISAATCPRRAAARSCAACSRRANWACRRGTCPPSKAMRDDRSRSRYPRPKPHLTREHLLRPAPPDDPHPPLRGKMRRALPAGEDPGLPSPLYRGGGGRGRVSWRRLRRRIPLSPPTASTAMPSSAASRWMP